MAQIIAQQILRNKNQVLALAVSSHGGGDFYRPMKVVVVEVAAGTKFTQRNRKNVVRAVEIGEYNGASTTGPKSQYAALAASAKSLVASMSS